MKLPPQSIETEQALLASVMFDNEALADISLLPSHFYKTAHQKIFALMQKLTLNNEAVDLLTLSDALKVSGQLDEVGGMAYLSKLIDIPISTNPPAYAKIVRDKANLRKLIEKSNRIMQLCFSEQKSPAEILEESQLSIMEIDNDTEKDIHIGDILLKNLLKMDDINRNGKLPGVMTGHSIMDGYMGGFHKQELYILAARPAMGKTALALTWAKHMSMNGDAGLIFSIEMPAEQLTSRMLSDESNLNGAKFRSANFRPDEWEIVNGSAALLAEMPMYIIDEPGINITRIASLSRKYKQAHNIKYIIIDYIQLIEGWTKEGQGPKAEISRALKKLSRALDLPVIALSQLNRGLESRNNKRPVMSDLRDSGALEQDADTVMFIYRDVVYNENSPEPDKAEIIFGKNRHGGLGTVPLRFEGKFTRFKNYYR